MKARRLIMVLVMFVFSAGLLNAGGTEKVKVENKIKNYFKDVMVKVKNESDFTIKREIINSSLEKLDNALATVSSYAINDQEINALNQLRSDIKTKTDELNGINGFKQVQDSELNNFSTYVMQDFETADEYLYISVTTIIIVALLLILLL